MRHCAVCKAHSRSFLVSTIVLNRHWFIAMMCNFSWADRVSLEVRDRGQLIKIPKLNIVNRKFSININ